MTFVLTKPLLSWMDLAPRTLYTRGKVIWLTKWQIRFTIIRLCFTWVVFVPQGNCEAHLSFGTRDVTNTPQVKLQRIIVKLICLFVSQMILYLEPLLQCRMPIWDPVRWAVYIRCSLPDTSTWHPGRQLHWTPASSHSAETGVLSARIGAWETLVSCVPIVAHWKVPIGWCSGGPLLLVQCHLISLNKLLSCEEQYNSLC
jgi:hypothetical protein